MHIESISLKNFKSFRDAHMEGIPKLCVLVGANGTGKSTLPLPPQMHPPVFLPPV